MDRQKKIHSLQSQLNDAIKRKNQHENNVPAIKAELEQFFQDQCDGPPQGQEILLSRKRRGFEERLQKERSGIETTSVEIEVLQKSLIEEGKKVMDEVLAALGKAYSESTALCELKNKQIGDLKWQVQQAQEEFIKLNLDKDNKHGAVRNFQKTWTPEMMVQLVTDPTNERFAKNTGFLIHYLDDHTAKEWHKAQDKRAKELKLQQEKAEQERKELQARNRRYYEQAVLICQGKLPMPDCFKDIYSRNEIPLNLLQDHLRRADAKPGDKQHAT